MFVPPQNGHGFNSSIIFILSRQRSQSGTRSSLGFPSSYFNPFMPLPFLLFRRLIALLCLSVAACGNRHSGRTQTRRKKSICLHQQAGQRAAKNNRPCACSCHSNPGGGNWHMYLMPYHFSSTVISVRFSSPSTHRSTKSILPKLSSSMIPALTSPSSIIFPL